jgi:hypothetical protein
VNPYLLCRDAIEAHLFHKLGEQAAVWIWDQVEKGDAYITGGALLSLLCGQAPRKESDIDVFATTQPCEDEIEAIGIAAGDCLYQNDTIASHYYLVGLHDEKLLDYMIKQSDQDVQKAIDAYDGSVCCNLFGGQRLYIRYSEDLGTKTCRMTFESIVESMAWPHTLDPDEIKREFEIIKFRCTKYRNREFRVILSLTKEMGQSPAEYEEMLRNQLFPKLACDFPFDLNQLAQFVPSWTSECEPPLKRHNSSQEEIDK